MRLPEFFTRLSPVRETLAAIDGGIAELSSAAEAANRQLHVSTADTALSLWETDYGLPEREGDSDDLRRACIHAAMAGGKTLTPAHLASMAVTVGNADSGTVEEQVADWQAVLYAEYENRLPADTTMLEAAVNHLRPAHLEITVVPRASLQGDLPRYSTLIGGCMMELYGSTETTNL